MTRQIDNGSMLKVDLPTTLLRIEKMNPGQAKSWKNGLGKTSEISIYPPKKDFHKDSFFWRLCENEIEADFTFPILSGFEYTHIVLPKQHQKPEIHLNHRGEEASTTIKPLFPYSWNAEWSTICKVNHGPVTSLQFLIKRDLGTAQFSVDKIANESGRRKFILGAFALVYVVEGHVRISLDENSPQGYTLSKGQTLYVERDEEASPTSMVIQASNALGDMNNRDQNATVIIIQITETKPKGAPSTICMSDYLSTPAAGGLVTGQDVPSKRRDQPRHKESLVIYDDTSTSEPIQQEPTPIYEPPTFEFLISGDTDVPPPVVRDRLVVEDFPHHTISTAWIKMMKQGLSEWLRLPVIVCRGNNGPVIGITAAVHGNELNGVPCIHRVIAELDVHRLHGTVVAVPCVNVSGYLKFTREFSDGRDLNRYFPGREDGFAAQVYCYQFMKKVVSQFTHLIDLHTASFGRVNSYYVRADMHDATSAVLARLQQPQIVLHNSGQDGTLRSAASARGIHAITVEIGNPQLFQTQYVQWSFMGIMRILNHFDMFPFHYEPKDKITLGPPNTILCSKGFWIYTRTGGVLEVYPGVNTIFKKDDLIARIKNIFGNVVDEYYAPCSGIVIGKSSNPVAMAGDRIVHVGVIKKKGESLPKEAKENY